MGPISLVPLIKKGEGGFVAKALLPRVAGAILVTVALLFDIMCGYPITTSVSTNIKTYELLSTTNNDN
jgi:hypothetical protein